MAVAVGIDLGTYQFGDRRDRGRKANSDPQRRGVADERLRWWPLPANGERLVGPARRQAILNQRGRSPRPSGSSGGTTTRWPASGKRSPMTWCRDRTARPGSRSAASSTPRRRSPPWCCASWRRCREVPRRRSPRRLSPSAYFNDAQRQAARTASRIAGLEVLRIINEPTAAALAYGLDKGQRDGAGVRPGRRTFDVSILDISDGVVEGPRHLGGTHLGGDDFDRRIVDYLADDFQRDSSIDLRADPQALQRLFEAAEKARWSVVGHQARSACRSSPRTPPAPST